MPPLYRLLEVAAYSILNYLPFLILAIYPFRNCLRFSYSVTCLLTAALTAAQLIMGVWAAFFSGGHSAIISAASTVLYAVFYFTAVKMPPGKTLFTLLMISNTANFIVVAAKCLEGQLFPALAAQSYRWSASVTIIMAEVIILIPIFFYIKASFTPAVEKEPSGFEWKYLWLIPATFYLTWFYNIYGVENRTSLEIALEPKNTVFFFFINIGAFLVYYVVAKLVTEQTRNTELEEKNHRLAMQSLQYENLQERIAEARKAKHDVRHHVTLMKEHLKNHEYKELEEYLNTYQQSLPDDTLISFCENAAVNTMLLYFAQVAKDENIDYDVKLAVPQQINISETDLSVLLGNLMENAVDACTSDTVAENRQIVIRGKADTSSLCLTIDNTFFGDTKQDHNGAYLSTKHKGYGIGIESAKEIAEKYNGSLQITQQKGLFCVSVLLNY